MKTELTLTTSGETVTAAGEIDQLTAPALHGALLALCADASLPRVTVDLRNVSYLDSAGLAALIEAVKRLRPAGRALRVIVAAGRQPEKVLTLGRFESVLEVVRAGEEKPRRHS